MKMPAHIQLTLPDNLGQIATIIRQDWKKMYFGAVPYLEALECLDSIDDEFGEDDAKSIVAYFLANAQSWRGETARLVKAKLNALLKAAR